MKDLESSQLITVSMLATTQRTTFVAFENSKPACNNVYFVTNQESCFKINARKNKIFRAYAYHLILETRPIIHKSRDENVNKLYGLSQMRQQLPKYGNELCKFPAKHGLTKHTEQIKQKQSNYYLKRKHLPVVSDLAAFPARGGRLPGEGSFAFRL